MGEKMAGSGGRHVRFFLSTCLSTWWAAPLGAVASPFVAAGGFIGLLMVRAVVTMAGADPTDAEATAWMSVWWVFFALGAGAFLFFAGLSVAATVRALWRRQWRHAAAEAGACVLFPGLVAIAFRLLPGPEDVYPGLQPETDGGAAVAVSADGSGGSAE